MIMHNATSETRGTRVRGAKLAIFAAVAVLAVTGSAVALRVPLYGSHAEALAACRQARRDLSSQVVERDSFIKDYRQAIELDAAQVQDAGTVRRLHTVMADIDDTRRTDQRVTCDADATVITLGRNERRLRGAVGMVHEQTKRFYAAANTVLASRDDRVFADTRAALAESKRQAEQAYAESAPTASAQSLAELRSAIDGAKDDTALDAATSINRIDTALAGLPHPDR